MQDSFFINYTHKHIPCLTINSTITAWKDFNNLTSKFFSEVFNSAIKKAQSRLKAHSQKFYSTGIWFKLESLSYKIVKLLLKWSYFLEKCSCYSKIALNFPTLFDLSVLHEYN